MSSTGIFSINALAKLHPQYINPADSPINITLITLLQLQLSS